jgi:uncharacterized protein (TIGR04255 family)
MEKDNIGRYDLKDNIMRSIIFRIDYQGIVDINPFINEFIAAFKAYFKVYETAYQNRIDLFMTSFEEISQTLALPVKEIEQQIIHRFTEFNIGKDRLTLDISKYYTVLQIDCTNYESVDEYLSFFSEFSLFIHQRNDFLQVRRLGLRKIGTSLYDKIEQLSGDLEPEYFDFDFGKAGFSPIKRELRDLLETKEGIRIDFRRGFESGQVASPDGGFVPKYQAVLDFDGIVQDQQLKELNFKEHPKNLLTLLNNTYLFEIFKMSVTDSFLERNRKK